MTDPAIIRLFLSQISLCIFFLVLTPIKEPKKRNYLIICIGAFLITSINAVIISAFGIMSFYIRYYLLTIVLPYYILLWFFAVHKGQKLLFGILSAEVFGNIAIANGLLASYIVYGKDAPLLDALVRLGTFLLFLPLVIHFIRPLFIKIAEKLKHGWWILNTILIVSYALAFFIAFVPETIFNRPEYFYHLYIGLFLSLLIYLLIFLLFGEIQSNFDSERDKHLLSIQVASLANQSVSIAANEEKMNILRHDMRHHLRIIREEIAKGNTEEAEKFLGYCTDSLSETENEIYCRNIVVNAALVAYINLAKASEINVETKLAIPEQLPFNSAELAVVFANAIENAINACMKITDPKERKISLVSRFVQNQLIIEIANTCVGVVQFDDSGTPVTLSKGHGIGTTSIAAFVHKYNALLDFSQEQNIFKLRLILQMNEQKDL